MDTKLMTLKEMAEALGITEGQLYYAIGSKQLPAPTHPVGTKLRYAVEDYPKLKRKLTDGTVSPAAGGDTLSAKAIQRLLGITQKVWERLRDRGKLDAIGHKIGKRWLYTEADVPKLRRIVDAYMFREDRNINPGRVAREQLGLFSQVAAAEALDMPLISFKYHLTVGNIPRPTHSHMGYMCYDLDDMEELRRWFAENYTPSSTRKPSSPDQSCSSP